MLLSIAIMLTLCLETVTAQASLLGRVALTPGGTDYQAYYDDVLNITWLADANYARTSGYDPDGLMTWSDSASWVASLNAANYLGPIGWRLPSKKSANGSDFNLTDTYDGSTDYGFNLGAPGTVYAGSTASEMGHLFYITLGNAAGYDFNGVGRPCLSAAPSYCLTNAGPFSNLMTEEAVGKPRGAYWYGTEDPRAGRAGQAMDFRFFNGNQGDSSEGQADTYAWAVRDGDIGVVPVPAALWLFGSALGVMGWIRRKAIV